MYADRLRRTISGRAILYTTYLLAPRSPRANMVMMKKQDQNSAQPQVAVGGITGETLCSARRTSTRQSSRVEMPVTHSKQMIGDQSNRQRIGGVSEPIRLAVWLFANRQLSGLEQLLNLWKQTVEARSNRQEITVQAIRRLLAMALAGAIAFSPVSISAQQAPSPAPASASPQQSSP